MEWKQKKIPVLAVVGGMLANKVTMGHITA